MKTPEKRAIAQAKADATRDEYSHQVIVINETFTVRRQDSRNWCIERRGEPDGFYSSPDLALLALPRKMLNEGQIHSIKDVCDRQREIMTFLRSQLAGAPAPLS